VRGMRNLIWLLCTCGVSVGGEAAVIETVLEDSEVPSEASVLRVAAMSIVAFVYIRVFPVC
jgi:uncharacterized membrane protein YadS